MPVCELVASRSMDEVGELILSGNQDAVDAYLDSRTAIVVDWREEDDAIIEYFAKFLPDESLSGQRNDEGLIVNYNGVSHPVPLTFSDSDRLITVRGIQVIIAPKYTVKLFRPSILSDTWVYYVRPTSWWDAMEQADIGRLTELFENVPSDSRALAPEEMKGAFESDSWTGPTYTKAADEALALRG